MRFDGDATILVVGDIILDRYMVGTVNRISPEAPVPIVSLEREFPTLGGAGNTAANIRSLSGKCVMLSAIGDDPASYDLMRLCSLSDHVVTVNGRATTVKTRIMSSNYQLSRVDREDRSEIPDKAQDQLIDIAIGLIDQASIVVISDYGKGVITKYVVQSLIRYSHFRGKQVIIDPKGSDYLKYAHADYVTPNLSELNQVMPIHGATDDAARDSARQLMDAVSIKNVLVTMSERGMMLVPRYGSLFRLPSAAKEVYDVTGAGDTVIAALALSLASKLEIRDAVKVANAAAGIVVGKIGTAVCDFDELQAALSGTDISYSVEHQVALWKSKGLTIGLANGCFDVLHAGHVHLLTEAKRYCDRLVVAINSDRSVSLLKGERRPINSQEQRAAVLQGLAVVDAVTVFDDLTPLDLIKRLRPNALIKGSDHTIESIVGADEVVSWGGSVYVVGRLEGLSTTNIVNRCAGGKE